ncbi:MAG: hypothetical protein Q4P66_00690 [Actinomycetaceae bacterium]|nr:hypothetical protein [Actinomycetaceae bacterium]
MTSLDTAASTELAEIQETLPSHIASLHSAVIACHYYLFLKCAWIPAIDITSMGCLFFAISVALSYSSLPWWAALFTPFMAAFPIHFLRKLPQLGKPALEGALFNLANLVWATAFLVLSFIYPLAP